MLSPELLREIRRIEIRTRRLVRDSLGGEYHSVFKGRGMEFDEVRPYAPGDEIRAIDWNVTARSGEAFVKRFVEERELTVLLLVDVSASGLFGSARRFKRELAAELAAVLAFAATTNNDKVGLLVFTDQVELYIPPRKGRRHVLRMARELLAFAPHGRATDIRMALDTADRLLKRRSIIFLISDFLDDTAGFERTIRMLNRRHDVIAVDLHDPLETALPPVGLLCLEDAETGALTWLDTADRAWRDQFAQRAQRRAEQLRGVFKRAGVDHISVATHADYVAALLRFFRQRGQRQTR